MSTINHGKAIGFILALCIVLGIGNRIFAECSPSACLNSHAFTWGNPLSGSGGEPIIGTSQSSSGDRLQAGYLPQIQIVPSGPSAPMSVNDLIIFRFANNWVLSWSPVTMDIIGNPSSVQRYDIYAYHSLAEPPELLDSTSSTAYILSNPLGITPRFFFVVAVSIPD